MICSNTQAPLVSTDADDIAVLGQYPTTPKFITFLDGLAKTSQFVRIVGEARPTYLSTNMITIESYVNPDLTHS